MEKIKFKIFLRNWRRCIYRPDRAHCTEYQCIPSVSSVHAFRKAEQSFDLLDYETHIVIVLCSPERIHSLTVQYALLHRYLQVYTKSISGFARNVEY